jgi:hypothetical protein
MPNPPCPKTFPTLYLPFNFVPTGRAVRARGVPQVGQKELPGGIDEPQKGHLSISFILI